MSTNYDELLSKIESGEIRGDSTFNVRNESLQTKVRFKRFDRLNRELRKNSKLLFQKELALPFNPATGEEDETFNRDRKFRPPLAPSTASILLKIMASKNEALYKTLLKRSGLEEWKIGQTQEELNTLTEEDVKVFRNYIVPRVFTIPVITISDQRITGFEYGADYTIEVDRDEFGKVVGEYPIALQANKLYRDIASERIAELEKNLEDAKDGKPYNFKVEISKLRGHDLATITDDDLKEAKASIYKDIIISEDRPSNFVLAYELPLDGSMDLTNASTYENLSVDDVDKLIRVVKVTKEIKAALEAYETGKYKNFDKHYDFWEIDMTCPSDVGNSTNQARDIAKETRYQNPASRLPDFPHCDKIRSVIKENMDNMENLEERFMTSVFIRKFDESVERKLLDVIEMDRIIKNNPYVTERVIKSNADFITLVYGEEGEQLVVSVDAGISEGIDEGNLDPTVQSEVSDALKEIMGSGEEDYGTDEETPSEEKTTGDVVEVDVVSISLDD